MFSNRLLYRSYRSVLAPVARHHVKSTSIIFNFQRLNSTGLTPPNPQDPKTETKPTIWDKIKHELAHYRDGTKLLGLEIKISSKLLFKLATGYELSRREHRQLERTITDILRLFPFLMFVIVPFLELLLPIALRVFPNLLPSTYESKLDKEKKVKMLRKTRTKVSETLREVRNKVKLPKNITEEESKVFHDFYAKLSNKDDQNISRDEIIKVARLYKDDLILDNLSRSELYALARYINLRPFGTDNILRYLIRNKMLKVKQDDKAISYEGVNNLTTSELQLACISRGIKVQDVDVAKLREDLQMWLKMRLVDKIPSTLIVLASAYNYGVTHTYSSQYEALKAVLSAIPAEIYHETQLNVSAKEEITHQQRLNVLKEQENLIQSENKQQSAEIPVRDTKSLDDDELEKEEPLKEAELSKETETKK